MNIVLKSLSFVLWVAVGFVVVPCMFVSGSIYPSWQKWGEDL